MDRKQRSLLFSLLFLLLQTSCATFPAVSDRDNILAYSATQNKTPLRRYLPIFVIENPTKSHNLIGTPRATLSENSQENVFVAPEPASIYTEIRRFETPRGSYSNLIYRIHFEKIPFSLFPFYISWGKNVGLIVVITLNSSDLPVLYTTVHTCGCYLAFIPTSFLPRDAFPGGWSRERQTVLGENLPALLDFSTIQSGQTTALFFLRKDTHRIKNITVSPGIYPQGFNTETALMKPVSSLENLPLGISGSTSFFEESGLRNGYVKGTSKPWEQLLMSWWALDWQIGKDKIFGLDTQRSPVFYTSLKPWAREASDMRSFSIFLKYWGWNL